MSPAKPTSQSAAELIRAPSKPRSGSPARSSDQPWQVVSIGGRSKPPFDVVESKLRVPPVRPGTVSRVALVNRLRTTTSTPVAIIAAPAGYGKTTLLAQWATRDPRPFGWVTLDERDDDPLILLRHVAVAIDRVEPLSAVTFESLRVPGGSVWSAALPRLASAVSSVDRQFVLVLDDADRVSSKESVEAIALLVEQVGAGSMLVLSGRTPPPIGMARLRAGARLLEIGSDSLAMSRREAALLLRTTASELTGDDVAELVSRTEGWPAGLYLGALAVRQNGHPATGPAVVGDDRNLAEYLRAEHLDRLPAGERAFLRRSAVLDRMSGPLCDAVLETSGSGVRLESMARANMFVVPLDGTGRWYRYHGLLRDLLRRELEEQEPVAVAGLNRRAADWFEEHGDSESALDPAAQAGDMARVARILAEIALPVYQRGRISDVEGWLDRFTDRGHLELHPELAVLGGWMHAVRGRSADARRWLDAAQRGSSAGTDGGLRVAVLRSAMCGEGVGRMLYDAQAAVAGLPPDTQWCAMALALLGVAYSLAGDDDQAESILAEASAAAEAAGATDIAVLALGERALLAERHGDDAVADGLAAIGRSLVNDARLEGYSTSAVALAVSARAMLRHGRWDQARSDLAAAEEACGSLTSALPWLAVQARLEIARAHVALRDADRARAMLDAAVVILDRCPGLGVLPARAQRLREEIEDIPEAGDATGSGLTGAELRLLPLLATHLSFREIGERLFVSRNTIKTQAISVYRKLGVTSRSGAIARAQELGLVDAAAPSASTTVTAGR
jgi:LuxR family maltose regulon positive regulatory protein